MTPPQTSVTPLLRWPDDSGVKIQKAVFHCTKGLPCSNVQTGSIKSWQPAQLVHVLSTSFLAYIQCSDFKKKTNLHAALCSCLSVTPVPCLIQILSSIFFNKIPFPLRCGFSTKYLPFTAFFITTFLLVQTVIVQSEDKSLYRGQVVVEHAEVIPETSSNNQVKVYMWIWNGTQEYIDFSRVLTMDGVELILMEPDQIETGTSLKPAAMPRPIPPSSEFAMNERGFHLVGSRAMLLDSVCNLPLVVEFSKRQPIRVDAVCLPSDSKVTEHHHGLRDD